MFASKRIGESERMLGSDHDVTLCLRWTYAVAIYKDPDASLQDLTRAVAALESVLRVRQRVFGPGNQATIDAQHDLKASRAVLDVRRAVLAERRAREAPS